MSEFKPGTVVRLKPTVEVGPIPKGRADNETATIRANVSQYSAGAVFTEQDLRGCRFWNIEDLEVVE